MKYDFSEIERRWQAAWQAQDTFAARNPGDVGFDASKPKFYVLAMFPYPSGAGAHMGHALNYTSTDIVARYRRMCGDNVLHPIGYDAFGLPAEQYAVEHGTHPKVTTEQNIAMIEGHFRRLGLSFDWNRCLATTDPDYYLWTQWIFLQMYESWLDPVAGKASPISKLEEKLAAGRLLVTPNGELVPEPAPGLDALGGPPIGAIRWHELSRSQRDDVLDRHRLAYLAEVPVNWCPALGTVLANEEITHEGRSDRGNHPVYKRPLCQWVLRITAYADRLLADLESVDWPEPIRIQQREWIGRSEGALVDFALVDDASELIQVFTTRPDTLFGATYMVLAPEHPLVERITTPAQRHAVETYRREAEARTDIDRMAETKTKTGVFTGAHAINPVNGQRIAIWVADYVLMGYGTGAIMAVPAHDDRDFAFAEQFDLPIRAVVMPPPAWLAEHAVDAEIYNDANARSPAAFTGTGINIHSTHDDLSLDGQETPEAKKTITVWLEAKQLGRHQVQYKLRDWLFSRQRYWGEPFPILHGEDDEVRAVAAQDLPVELPPMEDFKPQASDDPDAPVRTPLSRAPSTWTHVSEADKRYRRELNTMPQWAGSCWYYLRFLDVRNHDAFVGPDAERYWMVSKKSDGTPHAGGVDLYVGGAEHAVLHLLYARFWHKVLFDLGHVSTPEPFGRLFNQGYIQAYAYRDERGIYVQADEVVQDDRGWTHDGKPVTREFGKMGKSLKNSVTPDEVCDQYGADTLRLFLMYLGPLDQSKLWNPKDIVGVHRFLQRLWRNLVDETSGACLVDDGIANDRIDPEIWRKTHHTVKRVSEAMNTMAFNVAIAALIELNNALVPLHRIPRQVAERIVLCLAPLAPHISEELWQRMGHTTSLSAEPWPTYDPALLVEDVVDYPVQVNGKLRGRVQVAVDADDSTVEAAALAETRVQSSLEGREVKKVIVVPGRLVNIVAR